MLGKKKSSELYENRFQFLIDNILNVVAEVDSKGVFTYINPYIYDELGYQPEEIIGRSIFELIHPDDVKKIIKMLHRGIKSRGIVPEVRLKNKNNQFIWFDIKTTRIKDYESEIKIIIDLINVSKCKLLEKKLQEKEEDYQNLTKSFPEMQFWNVLIPKKYKSAIRTSSEMLKAIIENIPQCVYWKDTAFKYIGCNRNFIEFIGMDRPEDIIGKTNEELFSNVEMLQQIKEYEKSILKSGKPVYHIHETWITLEGKKIWLDSNKVPIFDLDEKIIGFLISFEEITNRKLVEENLHKSEEKYKNLSNELETILDVIPGMIFIKNKNDMYTKVNQVFADYLQLTKEEIVGKSTSDLFPQNLATNFSKDDLEVINSGIPKLNMEENVNFLGSKVTSIISKLPYYNEKEEIQGIIGLAIDISKRKKLEQELNTSEERYRNLFNNSPNMIALINLNGKLVDVNEAVLKFTGNERNNIIGRNFQDFDNFFAGNLPIIIKKNKEILKNGSIEAFELQLQDKNQRKTWVNLQAFLVEIKNEMFIQIIIEDITERKQAEQKLIESEEKFRIAIENNPDFMVFIKKDGTIFDINRVERGFSRETVVGQNVFNESFYETKDQCKSAQKAINDSITNRKTTSYEYSQTAPDGSYSFYETKVSPIEYDKEDKIISLQLATREITKRRNLEQKLIESEENYRLISENANDLIAIIDNDFKYEYINEQVHIKMMGYSYEDLLGKSALAFIHPDDFKEASKALKEGFEAGEGVGEARIRHKNGSYLWLEIKGKTFIDKDGIKKALLISRDIRERKKAEKKLRDSEEKYRSLVEDAQEGVWALDENENTIFVNPRICEMLGYSKNEMMGNNLHSFIPDSMEALIKENRSKRKKGIKETYELQLVKKDGNIIWTEVKAAPIMYENQRYKGSFAYITDITDRKNAVTQLKESEERLSVIAKSTPDYIMLLDCNANIKFINHTISDLKVDDVIDTSFYNYALKDYEQLTRECFEKVLKTGNVDYFESIYIEKCGKIHYFESHVAPVWDATEINGLVVRSTEITERKLTEQKIKDSEEKYRELYENAPNAYFSIKPDQTIKNCNKEAEKLLGYSRDELLDMKVFDLYADNEEGIIKAKKIFKDFLKGQKLRDQELLMKKKNGDLVWISLTINPILDNKENIIESRSMVIDISERKENEDSLRTLAHSLNERVKELQCLNNILKLAQIHKTPIEQFFINALQAISPAWQFPEITCVRILFNGQEFKTKNFMESKWSQKVDITIYGKKMGSLEVYYLKEMPESDEGPFLKEERELINTIGEIFKTTMERIKAEQDILTSEQKLKDLMEAAPIGIYISTPKGAILECNTKAYKIFGYSSKEEFLKLPSIAHYYNPKDREKYVELLDSGSVKDFEVQLKRRDGTLFWGSLNSITDRIGDHTTLINVFQDITDRRKTEEEIADLAKFPEENPNPVLRVSKESVLYANQMGQDLFTIKIGNRNPILVRDAINKTFEEKVTQNLEITHNSHFYSLFITPIKETNYANIYGTDITERKKREGEIRLQMEIIENMSEGVTLIKFNDGTIVFNNPAFEKMFGYNPGEMIGKDVAILNAPTDKTPEETKNTIMRILKDTEKWHGEVLNIKKDGTPFWCYANVSLFDHPEYGRVNIAVHTDITERKQAEQKLKASKERYRNISEELEMIIDLVPGSIFYKDTKNNFIRVNKYVADAHKMTKKELEGKSMFDLYPKEQAQNYWNDDLEVIKNKEPKLNIEEPWETIEGLRWISTSKIPFYNENNEIVGIIGFSIDITERKLAERKLKESKQLLQSTFDSLNDAIFILNAEMPPKIINCNSAAVKIFKYSYDEMIGQETEFLHVNEDELQKFQDHLYNIVEDVGYLHDFVFKMKRKTGVVFFSEHSVFPLVDDLGTRYGWVSVVRDITERKKGEQKLKESEEKYRMLVENAHDGVWAVDENDNTIFVNKRISKMLGYTKNEMIGKSLYEFLDDPMIELINSYRERRERGLKDTYNLEFIKKDGGKIYTNIRATAILGENREFKGSFAYITDITDRKITEQHLKESEQKYRNLVETSSMGLMEIDIKEGGIIYINPRLLEIVGYTEDELINNGMFYKAIYPDDYIKVKESDGDKDIEFRIINKKGKVKWLSGRTLHHFNEQGELIYLRLWLQDITTAKELEEIKSNLLTRVSHEIKTPLISIKGFTDLLLEEYRNNLDKQTIAFLEKIKEGGERLKLLINRFLEATQLEKGLVILNESYENLSLLIKKGIEDVEGLIKLRNHTIHVDIPDEIMIYLDKEKIQSVISNLLINAIKYTPSGGNITIKSRIKKNNLIYSIRDDGIGLRRKEIAQLFRPFGKIEIYGRGWDIISDGIGLGLYLSKEIIDLHNGKIWVESPGLDKGSTFYFSLPIISNNDNG